MSKGIIVVDVPADCRDCLIRSLADDCIVGRNVMEYRHNRNRPDWCPIRPLPEKKTLTGDVSNEVKIGEELVRAGWNACIDQILKGESENES